MSQYKVTLGMPIYNVANYIERTLLSVLNQSFESIEFILVDDRGKDDTMDIVQKIIAKHPRGKDVKVIEQSKNLGPGSARNSIIDSATAPYLFFMDSDDEITLDAIEKLYEQAVKTGAEVVVGNFEWIFINGNRHIPSVQKIVIDDEISACEYCLKGNFGLEMWNKLFKLDFVKSNNIRCKENHRFEEDVLFITQFALKVKTIVQLQDVTYKYYKREDSLTGVNFSEKAAERFTSDKLLTVVEMFKLYEALSTDAKKRLYGNRLIEKLFLIYTSVLSSKWLTTKKKREILRLYPNISVLDLYDLNTTVLRVEYYMLSIHNLFIRCFGIIIIMLMLSLRRKILRENDNK